RGSVAHYGRTRKRVRSGQCHSACAEFGQSSIGCRPEIRIMLQWFEDADRETTIVNLRATRFHNRCNGNDRGHRASLEEISRVATGPKCPAVEIKHRL